MACGRWRSACAFSARFIRIIVESGSGVRRSTGWPAPMNCAARSKKAQSIICSRIGLVRQASGRTELANIGFTERSRYAAIEVFDMLNHKRWSCLLAVFVLLGCGSPAPIRQIGGAPYDSTITEQLASGVVHRRLVANQGPFAINVIEVDVHRRDLVIRAMHAFDSLRGREQTSAMVARRIAAGTPVIAAVNADFFDLKTGENENNQVIDGVVLKAVPITDSPFDSSHT